MIGTIVLVSLLVFASVLIHYEMRARALAAASSFEAFISMMNNAYCMRFFR
jgi:hypothetical protein